MGFWLETLIGMVVMVVLVVLLGPGLWSSRVDIHKSDDKSRDKPPPPSAP
ncbi:hypothetical protein [Hyalangium minutum]|uniref:Uncharacterized protein n=1 Tax=Hyalangium minutum TaxID=394096 RepID=A0A085WPC8_9BACT|nr:hypothetical protein [Hyalangium minutum]KFE69541.1 hypothetical protein DB31_6516 [Hyalangium minutum]